MTDDSKLSVGQARGIALAAQGFSVPRPTAPVDRNDLHSVLSRTQLLQIDSVYVLERAHYVPIYSRLGPYAHELLDAAAYNGSRKLFEYWGHAASLLPVELHPFMRWRMRAAQEHAWGGMRQIARHSGFVEEIYDEVAARGPVSARELEDQTPRDRSDWGWNWSDAKNALEWLFRCGRLSVAARPGFERHYDLTERVIPGRVLALPTPTRPEAIRALVARSARSLGVATVAALSDYFRLTMKETHAAVGELVESEELIPVTVEGWDKPAFLHKDAQIPARVEARALVSPFDPIVWNRDRTQRLFDFHYRIEIYVPRAKRTYGYYVLPFLLGDAFVARVDLKADRKSGCLVVAAAWREPDARGRDDVEVELAEELREMALWLGLSDIRVEPRGDLADSLAARLT